MKSIPVGVVLAALLLSATSAYTAKSGDLRLFTMRVQDGIIRQWNPNTGTYIRNFAVLKDAGGVWVNTETDIACDGLFFYSIRPGDARVRKWDLKGNYIGEQTTLTDSRGQTTDQTGIATDGTSFITIAKGDARVRKFDFVTGKFVGDVAFLKDSFGLVTDQTGIAIDGDFFYTVTAGNPAVHQFDLSGNYVGELTSLNDHGAPFVLNDGIAAFTRPLTLDIRVSQVSICWNSDAGKVYQVQYRPKIGNQPWTNLGAPVVGNGDTMCVTDSVGLNERFYQVEELVNPGDLTRWVWILPGTFTMGSPESEVDREGWEGPQTFVTISRGFWLGTYEVTQAEYQAVMGSNPSVFTGNPSRPVESVTWSDATDYCAKLTEWERAARRIAINSVYRLPTEAEWEYACRAGTTTRFSYGDDPGYNELAQYAWYYDNSSATTHVVGQKKPNPWGLYDMHGNVWEWCVDWFGFYPGGNLTDPRGPSSGSDRVFRGGSWGHFGGGSCRAANRLLNKPDFRNPGVGFRVVLAPGQ